MLKVNIWFLTTIILILVLGGFLFKNYSQKDQSTNSNTKTEQTTPTPKAPKISQEELISQIKNITVKSPDTEFSISIIDLSSNVQFGINDGISQHAASVSKVLTAAYLLKQTEEGKYKLSDPLGVYNIEFQLKQMVNQSNNNSWDLIDNLVGFTAQEQYAHSIGLTSVDIGNNKMSSKDAASLLSKIYKSEILNEQSKARLFSYMQNTETENLISPAIPKDVTFYHKTGLFEGEVHDAVIVDLASYPYVISVFSVNTLVPNYEGRGKIMQEIAATVHKYFAK
jgi:beta-lactamase class A